MNDLDSNPDLQFGSFAKPPQEQDLAQFAFPPFDPAEPLPEYTRSWGAHLRRPTTLPEHYDTRIDPNHIFVFAVHPITGIKRDFFVTPKPCEYCAKIRQVCSRSRPSCQRCTTSGDPDRVCHVEDGWVKLPGPKCEKPKLQKKSQSDMAKDGKASRARSSTADNPPLVKRPRTLAPHPFDESLSPLSSTPTPSSSHQTYTPTLIPKKPPPKRAAHSVRIDDNGNDQSLASSSTVVNGKKKAVVAQKATGRKGKKVGKRNMRDGKSKDAAGAVLYVLHVSLTYAPERQTGAGGGWRMTVLSGKLFDRHQVQRLPRHRGRSRSSCMTSRHSPRSHRMASLEYGRR